MSEPILNLPLPLSVAVDAFNALSRTAAEFNKSAQVLGAAVDAEQKARAVALEAQLAAEKAEAAAPREDQAAALG